jgi:hypothetical protein
MGPERDGFEAHALRLRNMTLQTNKREYVSSIKALRGG